MKGVLNMTFAEIIANASAVVTEIGTSFASLATNFAGPLAVPVALVVVKSGIIGNMKGLLFYRRGRGR